MHTAEIEQDPNKVEGGKGDILINAVTTAEQKSVARGLIIDPGGKIVKVQTTEIEQDPNKVEGGKGDILLSADLIAEQKSVARGFLLDPGGDSISPKITGDWKRNSHEEGQGESDVVRWRTTSTGLENTRPWRRREYRHRRVATGF